MTTHHHVALSVRGAIDWPKRQLAKLLRDSETGQYLTAAEARSALLDELSCGVEVLPLGEPCEGWDPKTGCPGHAEADA